MSDNNYAVYGLNYGGEGKGNIINYLAQKHSGDEIHGVRLSGSIQSNQTVRLKSGITHEFRHFSAASCAGARTIIGRHVQVSPTVFRQERDSLISKGVLIRNPLISEECSIITPYDILANQIDQTSNFYRNLTPHGTSGLGIFYSDHRDRRVSFRLKDLKSRSENNNCLSSIRGWYENNQWGFGRPMPELYKDLWHSKITASNFLDDLEYLQQFAEIGEYAPPIFNAKTVIFEQPLGIGLCRNYSTSGAAAICGSSLIHDACMRNDIRKLKNVYVTRPYVTRYGNINTHISTPTPQIQLVHKVESPDEISPKIKETPFPVNQYLGSVQYGIMSIKELRLRINNQYGYGDNLLAITCLDQFQGKTLPYRNYKTLPMTEKKWKSTLSGHLSMPILLTSYGPTHEGVVENEIVPIGV